MILHAAAAAGEFFHGHGHCDCDCGGEGTHDGKTKSKGHVEVQAWTRGRPNNHHSTPSPITHHDVANNELDK